MMCIDSHVTHQNVIPRATIMVRAGQNGQQETKNLYNYKKKYRWTAKNPKEDLLFEHKTI